MDDQAQPTRYIIQDKHFSLDDKFVISDESGEIHYKVDSTLFAMGDKLILSDAEGNELIKIRQETLHFHPTYNISSVRREMEEMHLATIRRTGAPWNHRLEINATNGEYLMEKKGGVFSHEFVLTKDGVMVAIVTKDVAPSTSVYFVDIAGDRNDYRAFLMALVIVLSCAQRLPGNPLAMNHGSYIKL